MLWFLLLLHVVLRLHHAYSHVVTPSDSGDKDPASFKIGFHDFHEDGDEMERLKIYPRHEAPQVRWVQQPGALWMAANIREVALLPGDRLVLHDAENTSVIQITRRNQSLARRAWTKPLLWDHPFLLPGNSVTIAYWPSLRTLILPIDRSQLDNPVAVIDSYTFMYAGDRRATGNGSVLANGSSNGSDTSAARCRLWYGQEKEESLIGSDDDMKPAVCFKQDEPTMYRDARSVARLVMRREPEDPPFLYQTGSTIRLPSTHENQWAFCTGWLFGRGNHLMTNYHCLFQVSEDDVVSPLMICGGSRGPSNNRSAPSSDSSSWVASIVWNDDEQNPTVTGSSYGSNGISSGGSGSGSGWSLGNGSNVTITNSSNCVTPVTVNFAAEKTTCRAKNASLHHSTARHRVGEPKGVIVATNASIVVCSEALDYCLLRIHSVEDLSRQYGFLTARSGGPRDGEQIFIPQHPRGKLKTISATDDGQPATLHVVTENAIRNGFVLGVNAGEANTTVWYDADTDPGSSGSPVLSRKDNTVVALHRAGAMDALIAPLLGDDLLPWNCSSWTSGSGGDANKSVTDYALLNSGVRMDAIVTDLRARASLPPCALARDCPSKNETSLSTNKTAEVDPCCQQID